jgi:hypothetical protein
LLGIAKTITPFSDDPTIGGRCIPAVNIEATHFLKIAQRLSMVAKHEFAYGSLGVKIDGVAFAIQSTLGFAI